jgi:hypothetical protein
MNLKQLVAQGSIAGVLAVSAIGAALAVSADPDWEDRGNNEWVDNDWRGDQWRFDNGRFDNDWEWKNWNDNDWDKWWRVNKWRNDDQPPWGWGAPPPVQWWGHIPHDFDYWASGCSRSGTALQGVRVLVVRDLHPGLHHLVTSAR